MVFTNIPIEVLLFIPRHLVKTENEDLYNSKTRLVRAHYARSLPEYLIRVWSGPAEIAEFGILRRRDRAVVVTLNLGFTLFCSLFHSYALDL